MAERPNALALKASVGKTTGGSNPSASAASPSPVSAGGGLFSCLLAVGLVLVWAHFGHTRRRSGRIEGERDGVEVLVEGQEKPGDDGTTTVALTVTCDGAKVLGVPRAVLRPARD